MKWKDILEMLLNGQLKGNDDVIVYDQATGEEYDCDLIQFDDTGEIAIVINGDED